MTEAEAFRLSIEHTQEMVLFYDRRGIIFFANQSAEDLLGYDSGVAGHAVADILPGAFRERDGIFDLNTSLDLDGFSAEAYRENRTCFPVWTRILNQQEELGIVFAMDVSRGVYLERQVEHADQEVLEASKVKTEFVANVTHELRTPVNGILGNALELKEMETDGAKLRVLSLIERGCTDMNAIINNILDFSKLESGKFTLEKRKFNFREMLDYVRQSHKIKVAEKGLDFVVSCADDIPEYIVGDELRIAQVLNNLISNACKFTSVGRISVEAVNTSRQDNKMELFFLVIDTGIGIAKEDQDKLFQSFSQVDASISRRYGGTGLGLNICKQLVELMDGTIHVDSDVGKGSVFSFHIWVEIPETEQQEAQQPVIEDKVIAGTEPVMSKTIFPVGSEPTKEGRTTVGFSYPIEENNKEIKRKLNKLILSVEMDNWEKAENFATALRNLTTEAPKDVKNTILRIKMAVQKEDYEKTSQNVELLRTLLAEDE